MKTKTRRKRRRKKKKKKKPAKWGGTHQGISGIYSRSKDLLLFSAHHVLGWPYFCAQTTCNKSLF
jgi:hypothetical protein